MKTIIWVHPDKARDDEPAIQVAELDEGGEIAKRYPPARVAHITGASVIRSSRRPPTGWPHAWVETESEVMRG